VNRKTKASEQPTPIPAFAAVERLDLLSAEEDKEFLELGEGVGSSYCWV
jgi:hypothetical protein